MQKQITQDNVVIKIQLDNIEQSASQPVLKKMLAEKWNIMATVPVEDGGKPVLIIILSPPKEVLRIDFPLFPYITDILIILILCSIFAAQIFFGGAGV